VVTLREQVKACFREPCGDVEAEECLWAHLRSIGRRAKVNH